MTGNSGSENANAVTPEPLIADAWPPDTIVDLVVATFDV
jgi:hypothetical protein